METFLDSITQSIVNDSHVTTDGNGHVTVVQIKLTQGSITRIALIGDTTVAHGSGGTSVSHGMGVTPSFVIPVLDAGSPTGPVSIFINYGTMNSSSFTAYTSGSIDTGNVRFFCMAL